MKAFFTQKWKNNTSTFRRVLLSLLATVLAVSSLGLNAQALWDGQGNTGGDSNAIPVVGGFSLPFAGPEDIIGYRFTVYATVAGSGFEGIFLKMSLFGVSACLLRNG